MSLGGERTKPTEKKDPEVRLKGNIRVPPEQGCGIGATKEGESIAVHSTEFIFKRQHGRLIIVPT